MNATTPAARPLGERVLEQLTETNAGFFLEDMAVKANQWFGFDLLPEARTVLNPKTRKLVRLYQEDAGEGDIHVLVIASAGNGVVLYRARFSPEVPVVLIASYISALITDEL